MNLPTAHEVEDAARRLGSIITTGKWIRRHPDGPCYCPLATVAIDMGLVTRDEIEAWQKVANFDETVGLFAERLGLIEEDIHSYLAGIDDEKKTDVMKLDIYQTGALVRRKLIHLIRY